MESIERSRVVQIALAEDDMEELLVTPVSPNRYRLEESSISGEVKYHDIIEAEADAAGVLRLLRTVTPSGLKVITWLVPATRLESPSVSALLNKVVAVGGNWEKTVGGVLMRV